MNSFGREKRLLTAEAFGAVFKRNRRSADHLFTILAHKHRNRAGARLGLAIAKRNLKKAHDRNRVKRIVRESFRLHQDQLDGLDLVVMIRPNIDVSDGKKLHQSLEAHWAALEKL